MTIGGEAVKKYRRGIRRIKKRLDKPCIIFSADYFVKYFIDMLTDFDITVAGIIDNNRRKQGKKCYNLPIMPVEDVIGRDVYIIIASGLWRAMAQQLESYGLRAGKDFFVIDIKNKRAGEFLSFWDLCVYFFKFIRGIRTAGQIIKKYGSDKTYYLHHLPCLGDIYVASLYLPGYMGCAGVSDMDCVLIVTNNACRKLAEALGYKYIEVISWDAKNSLIYAMAISEERIGIRRLVFSAYGSSIHINYLNRHPDMSFCDVFYPYLFTNNAGNKITLPRFKPDMGRIEGFFAANGLVRHKTVVLSPYAGSFKNDVLPGFWENIAARLTQNGYTVCTNSAGDNEPVIKGSIGVCFPFEDSVAFMENAGFFIGIRSGLCDIISSARCVKIVLYESVIEFGGEFFSLNKMGLCDDVIEYDISVMSGDELFDGIMGHLI